MIIEGIPERCYHLIQLSPAEKYYLCGDESGLEEVLRRNKWKDAEVWSFWNIEDLHNWESNPASRLNAKVQDVVPPKEMKITEQEVRNFADHYHPAHICTEACPHYQTND